MIKKPKVFVGVSGGVDSSVALALLKKQGYDVTGVFLKVWNPDWLPCNWKEERRSAMRVCAILGVPFLTFDFEKEYKKEVVDYMIREYNLGRVPNPDIFCNKYIKFGSFLTKSLEMGADFIATGHYAKIEIRDKRYELRESEDKEKDQSYFLYTLGQNELSHTLFSVGGMRKSEVRKLAKQFGLPTATKKDSQGLCFIGKVDMKDFLSHYIETKKGDVLNTKGEIIGSHDGAIFYAIGQRHGFVITKKSPEDPRFFVVAKDIKKNIMTVASSQQQVARKNSETEIFETQNDYATKEIIVKDLHFISGIEPIFPFQASVRIRYRQEKQSCTLVKKPNGLHVVFDNPQNGISVGQSAVFYDRDLCLGGGIIEIVGH